MIAQHLRLSRRAPREVHVSGGRSAQHDHLGGVDALAGKYLAQLFFGLRATHVARQGRRNGTAFDPELARHVEGSCWMRSHQNVVAIGGKQPHRRSVNQRGLAALGLRAIEQRGADALGEQQRGGDSE